VTLKDSKKTSMYESRAGLPDSGGGGGKTAADVMASRMKVEGLTKQEKASTIGMNCCTISYPTFLQY
jgi:hypothetical protein